MLRSLFLFLVLTLGSPFLFLILVSRLCSPSWFPVLLVAKKIRKLKLIRNLAVSRHPFYEQKCLTIINNKTIMWTALRVRIKGNDIMIDHTSLFSSWYLVFRRKDVRLSINCNRVVHVMVHVMCVLIRFNSHATT